MSRASISSLRALPKMTTELTPTALTHPECDRFALTLGDYYKGTEDLRDYQARLSRADADQESALSSQTLGDEEIAEEISKLISLKAVLAARIERKQTDLAGLTSRLEAGYQPANREFGGLLSAEIDSRKELITTRVTEALEIASDLTVFETVSFPAAIVDLMQFSQPVREISSLRPTMYWGSPGDGAAISTAANTLLENLKKFEELTYESEAKS
jgi:hypothetical protein